MIRQTCSCGATFECTASYPHHERERAAEWRTGHKCIELVELIAERDSGPGFADVVDRLTSISEHVALIGRRLEAEAARRRVVVQ